MLLIAVRLVILFVTLSTLVMYTFWRRLNNTYSDYVEVCFEKRIEDINRIYITPKHLIFDAYNFLTVTGGIGFTDAVRQTNTSTKSQVCTAKIVNYNINFWAKTSKGWLWLNDDAKGKNQSMYYQLDPRYMLAGNVSGMIFFSIIITVLTYKTVKPLKQYAALIRLIMIVTLSAFIYLLWWPTLTLMYQLLFG